MKKTVLMLALMLLAAPASADKPKPAEGQRIPLDSWRPEVCPEASKPGEVVVCGRPRSEPPPTVPAAPPEVGDRKTDVQAEREALVEHGRTGPSSCSAIGPGGESGCLVQQWQRARKTREKEEEVPR